jgi:hypothetical protein
MSRGLLSFQTEPTPTRGDHGLLEKPVRGEAFQGDFHPVPGEAPRNLLKFLMK